MEEKVRTIVIDSSPEAARSLVQAAGLMLTPKKAGGEVGAGESSGSSGGVHHILDELMRK
jgi:hypothetical protein